MAQTTLNKDGTPRKKGSGKTKGAGCFTKISWRELQEYVGENTLIPVSRVWLRSLDSSLGQITKQEKTAKKPTSELAKETVESEPKPEPEVTPESKEKDDSEPIVAVTPPYRYSQNFDL